VTTFARAHASELLSQLSDPVKLAIVADLGRRAADGRRPLLVAEIAAAVDVPIRDAAEAVSRLYALGVVERVGYAYRARLASLRDASAALDAEHPVQALLAGAPRLRSAFSHGRLVAPPNLVQNGTELARLLGELIAFEGTVPEAEINRRLAVVTDDVAALRRLMVEEGVLSRSADGTAYALTEPATPARAAA